MSFQPGQKIAHRMAHRPDLLALGKVQEDGKSARWYEVVDSRGVHSNALGQGVGSARPVPLAGDEQPCPQEFQHLIP